MRDEVYRLVGAAAHWLYGLPAPVVVGVLVALFGLTLWAHWVIVKRAGYPGCWSLMLLVPCLNVIFILGFAFSRWPVQGEKRQAS